MSPAVPATHPSCKAYLALALVLPIFAIAPLFYPGYIQTHSGFIPIWNVADLRANFGTWHWAPHLAVYFDPLRGDGLLPYYLAGVLPVEPATAIKIVLGLSWLLGSGGIFLWLKGWLGSPGALAAALVYTYLPYHLATVYVRGAWGEALFWGLLPWAILISRQVAEVTQDATRFTFQISRFTLLFFIWLVLGLSQLGLALWAFGLVLVLLLLILPSRSVVWPGITSFFGVILALIISFASSPHPATSPLFADHFLYPFQLFSAFWGFGPSRAGWNDGLSFQVGLAAAGLALLSVTLWQRHGSGELSFSRTDRRLIFFAAVAVLCLLLQFGFTNFLWQIPLLPGYTLADTLTYPWQLAGFVGLGLAVLAGAALWLDTQLARLPLFGAIVLLVVLTSYPYLNPRFIQLDSEMKQGPQAQLGTAQLGLLSYSFEVTINNNTAGLERSATSKIPLPTYGPWPAHAVLNLQVTWQPFQPFAENWKVFVHLVDPNDNVLAQFDGLPLEGTYPTSHWIPGELIHDTYPLLFPADAPAGPYHVFLGLYNETTGQRLPVPGDSEGRVRLNVE